MKKKPSVRKFWNLDPVQKVVDKPYKRSEAKEDIQRQLDLMDSEFDDIASSGYQIFNK